MTSLFFMKQTPQSSPKLSTFYTDANISQIAEIAASVPIFAILLCISHFFYEIANTKKFVILTSCTPSIITRPQLQWGRNNDLDQAPVLNFISIVLRVGW